MKEQSMNQNANQMIDWVDKFQMTRNTSSIDFVIQPGNDGFSNCEQSPNNDSWGDETHRFGRNRHLGPIFYDEQSISLIWKFKFQPSKKLERGPTADSCTGCYDSYEAPQERVLKTGSDWFA